MNDLEIAADWADWVSLLLQQPKFESCRSIQFLCKICLCQKRTKINKKRTGLDDFLKKPMNRTLIDGTLDLDGHLIWQTFHRKCLHGQFLLILCKIVLLLCETGKYILVPQRSYYFSCLSHVNSQSVARLLIATIKLKAYVGSGCGLSWFSGQF